MRRLAANVALAALGAILPLLSLEIAARLVKGKPITYVVNFVEARQTLLRSVYPTQADPDLGWIPRTGVHGSHNYWGKSITILDHGIRYNGQPTDREKGAVIVTVGDSFTFGDQVADHETWPAQLEEFSNVRVVNGGVFGYGLDQTVIRAEKLVKIFDPGLVVISFIPEDISRTELSVRSGVAKPYFDIVDDTLRLRNSPVPLPGTDAGNVGLFRKVLGYSFLTDGLMRKLGFASFWYLGGWESLQAHTEGEKVSCLLMNRLGDLSKNGGTRVVLLAQYMEREVRGEQASVVKKVLACARENGLAVLDLFTHLRKLSDSNPVKLGSLYYYQSHMTGDGNAVVARILLEYLMGNSHVGWSGPALLRREGWQASVLLSDDELRHRVGSGFTEVIADFRPHRMTQGFGEAVLSLSNQAYADA